ncbi:MAG: TRAP transporter fused permease subunit [Deltaproteobacteria bacterium]|nr:TRAP transporter fused permease subunit [Deltaproteobacteria bacterium]
MRAKEQAPASESGGSKEGHKAKQREFTGIYSYLIDGGLAAISLVTLYWSFHITSSVIIKRSLFLMLSFVLCAILYPFGRKSDTNKISRIDTGIIILAISGSLYAMYDSYGRFMRLSELNAYDILFGIIMIIIGLDIGRRVIGWTLTLFASGTILYTFFGNLIPGQFGHPGFDMTTVISQVYCGLEGYYGMVTKIMLNYIVPFIVLGAFLEKTGASKFFIDLAFTLTSRTVGGPAKAAVIGSALMGSINGTAIANVSSTGVLTIPLMKQIGYRPHIAAAIEATASTGGTIMPPVMGAVAFIMVEFTQIPYLTIIKVAAIPAVLYFVTVFAFVHFEALKNNIKFDGEHNGISFSRIIKSGWHYFLPLIAIVVIMMQGYPPGMAALGGIITLLLIQTVRNRRLDLKQIYASLVLGGKNSLGIGSVAACIGIILALVGLTGIGLKFSWFLSELSHGIHFIAILLVGLISMILGMGLATGPAYIVLAIMAGPALTEMGFPILIAHMIMVWFSIDSMITPPVGMAAIVASGIAGSPPFKTMFTSFKLGKGLYILPFMFYYRPAILLEGSPFIIIETITSILFGLITFAAFWEKFLLKKTTFPERLMLLIATACFLFPGLLWNTIGLILSIGIILNQKRTFDSFSTVKN